MLGWRYTDPISRQPTGHPLSPVPSRTDAFSFWLCRRIIYAGHYAPDRALHEATVVNWPQNDCVEGNVKD
jgi:hypothetical protein